MMLADDYREFAVVNERCPLCRQGRIFIAIERDEESMFVVCEDCETEWSHPRQTIDTSTSTRGQHAFSRYMKVDELEGHPWFQYVLTK